MITKEAGVFAFGIGRADLTAFSLTLAGALFCVSFSPSAVKHGDGPAYEGMGEGIFFVKFI